MPRFTQRPFVSTAGPVVPGTAAAVGEAVSIGAQAVGNVQQLKAQEEIATLQHEDRIQKLQTQQSEKMDRSRALRDVTQKHIARTEAFTSIMEGARKEGNYDNVVRDMDAWETGYDNDLFEGSSQFYQDTMLTLGRAQRTSFHGKAVTLQAAGNLNVNRENYSESVANMASVGNVDPHGAIDSIQESTLFAEDAGLQKGYYEPIIKDAVKGVADNYLLNIPASQAITELDEFDSVYSEDQKDKMKNRLIAKHTTVTQNALWLNNSFNNETGINLLNEAIAGTSPETIRSLIDANPTLTTEQKTDYNETFNSWFVERDRWINSGSPKKPDLTGTHTQTKRALNVLTDGVAALRAKAKAEDKPDDEEIIKDLNELYGAGFDIVVNAWGKNQTGGFGDKQLSELQFELWEFVEAYQVINKDALGGVEDEKGVFSRYVDFISSGGATGMYIRSKRPQIPKGSRVPVAIVSQVRNEMFAGKGKYANYSTADKDLLGTLMIDVALRGDHETDIFSAQGEIDAEKASKSLLDTVEKRFIEMQYNLTGDAAEELRGADGEKFGNLAYGEAGTEASIASAYAEGIAAGSTREEMRATWGQSNKFNADVFESVANAHEGIDNPNDLLDDRGQPDLALTPESENRLVTFIKGEEGERRDPATGQHVAYFDTAVSKDNPEGIPTVGYGHRILPEDNLKVGDTITEEQAEEFLRKDKEKAVASAEKGVPNWDKHPEEVQHVLISMIFQMGEVGVLGGVVKGKKKDGFKLMKAALAKNPPDYNEAADEMLDSDWAKKQTPERAKRAAEIVRSFAE